jgi:hypothetical protein
MLPPWTKRGVGMRMVAAAGWCARVLHRPPLPAHAEPDTKAITDDPAQPVTPSTAAHFTDAALDAELVAQDLSGH